MNGLPGKISLGLQTYWQARCAITRQFSAEKIISVQNVKLRRLIDYCFDNIKYYRETFSKAGIAPGQVTSADDLRNVPFLTRNELRSRFWDFLPRELPACRTSRTSGSTGVPVCLLSDRRSRIFNSAAVIRYRRALGVGLYGKPILTPLKNEDEPNKRPHWTFLQGIHKTYYINPYNGLAENIEYGTQLLQKLKKPVLIGITPAIRALASKIRDGVFPTFQPSVILTTGEVLEPEVRELLECTFKAMVADIYACNEAGDVAWQCRCARGYHTNADNVIVEIVRDDRPVEAGQIGEVVITNLNRYAMPIIRYKNGDLARLSAEPCPCGCSLPMIAEIVGRTGEDIFGPDGRTIPWNRLKGLMNHPQVRQFQLVQQADGSLTVRYVPENHADRQVIEMETLLRTRFEDLLGPAVPIQMEKVDQIAPAPSGKIKLVISDYKPNE
jgi:phenylacetate-CoA ligase